MNLLMSPLILRCFKGLFARGIGALRPESSFSKRIVDLHVATIECQQLHNQVASGSTNSRPSDLAIRSGHSGQANLLFSRLFRLLDTAALCVRDT